MLPDSGSRDPREMAAALRLPRAPAAPVRRRRPGPARRNGVGQAAGAEMAGGGAAGALGARRGPSWPRFAPRMSAAASPAASLAGRVAFVLKGYPRLSETFIAQEIAALERRGLDIQIVSLRHPTDRARHPVHERIRAPVLYLPEYLKDAPRRVLAGWREARRLPGYGAARLMWLADLPAIRRRTASGAGVRRWFWRPKCRPISGMYTLIFCIPRPRSRAMPRQCAGFAGPCRRMPRTSGQLPTGKSGPNSPRLPGP